MAKRAKSSKSKVRSPRAKPRVAARSHKRGGKAVRRDPFDDFVDAAARALDLPIAPAWRSSVKANLAVTFALAELFVDFPLPGDAEPAPVFSA